ncbi:hypothetical protein MF271_00345 (plasmid) [Deinococcus sp. KNUC1210]|uniref:hypothetical protein n=1 Tax=Deinococcus sp. KNUC1210 TaxID=2917691 RepID=UPI001EF007F5|nr:hypothetical protein [Deinococcus sp. KNUC1210]ULH13841.1 hypothetical protein MF271_00345 [Deinococcus sp. KNUC1210]
MTAIGGPRWLIGALIAVITAAVVVLAWGIVNQPEYPDLLTPAAPPLASADVEQVRDACVAAVQPLLMSGAKVDSTYPSWVGNRWVQAGRAGGHPYVCQVTGIDSVHLKTTAKLN